MSVSVTDMKKALFFILGWFCLIMAYIGVVTPGIPFSIFLVGAAYCFARSSKKMENWIYNHRHFGPFLTNWEKKRVFPQNGKYAMIAVMSSSLVFMMFFVPVKGVIYSGIMMALVAIWAWRYPSTVEEWQQRKDNGKKIGWFK
jgi:uncharacterized membrane protein YbaN (DUF454 family)